MKKLFSTITLGALALALPVSGFAAEKKTKAAPEPAAAPAEGAKKAAEVPAPGTPKALPMNTKVDSIDAAAKTFTHTNKPKGTEAPKTVKFVVTDKTEIKNGEAAAKFADIKVGDTVSGLRLKKSDTEYEVVKITKFGIAPPKPKKPKTEGEAKPAADKAGEKPAEKPAEKKP